MTYNLLMGMDYTWFYAGYSGDISSFQAALREADDALYKEKATST